MRYTTVIDISEIPYIYRNKNVCRLYFHLCLKAGYHDDDRDIIRLSVRGMAYETGLSLSATRNAIAQLLKYGLLEKTADSLKVRKFVVEMPISKRARKRKDIDTGQAIARALEEEREDRIRTSDKSGYMVYYERQLEKSKTGDKDALRYVEKNKKLYEEACKNWNKQ